MELTAMTVQKSREPTRRSTRGLLARRGGLMKPPDRIEDTARAGLARACSGRTSPQHQLQDLDRLLEVERLACDRIRVEERLDDAHERIGHRVCVDRQPERSPPHLLLE